VSADTLRLGVDFHLGESIPSSYKKVLNLPNSTPITPISNAPPMSYSYSKWFKKGVDPGTIISLNKPGPSQWKIMEKLNEHDFQVHKGEHDDWGTCSFASAKLLCCDPKDRTKTAFMRVYVQVPHRTTEMDDAGTRGQQATGHSIHLARTNCPSESYSEALK
jgi:hypothetical protein